MDWVLDASMALAWALPDEHSKKAEQFMDRAAKEESGFWTPALWWYETGNALLASLRRGRMKEAETLRFIELCGKLPIKTDADLNVETLWRYHALAQSHRLSVYDASYLELAQRRGIGLATLDHQLQKAAKDSGVKVP